MATALEARPGVRQAALGSAACCGDDEANGQRGQSGEGGEGGESGEGFEGGEGGEANRPTRHDWASATHSSGLLKRRPVRRCRTSCSPVGPPKSALRKLALGKPCLGAPKAARAPHFLCAPLATLGAPPVRKKRPPQLRWRWGKAREGSVHPRDGTARHAAATSRLPGTARASTGVPTASACAWEALVSFSLEAQRRKPKDRQRQGKARQARTGSPWRDDSTGTGGCRHSGRTRARAGGSVVGRAGHL